MELFKAVHVSSFWGYLYYFHRYWGEGFVKYAVEVALGGMTCIRLFMTIGSGIQII
jgi:hypothetical protein